MTFALTFVGTWPPELQEAGERVLAAFQQLMHDALPEGIVNIKLVDDAEIAQLNKQYTGNAGATDVLTFPYAENGAVAGELADIVISTQTAERQAKAAGVSVPDEVGLLLLHGLIHALGHDHATDAGQSHFDRVQREVLELAGITYREFTWKD